jgi:hypothetical protein
VALPDAPQNLPGASVAVLQRRAAGLFQSLDYTYYDGKQNPRSERLRRLKAMGRDAMRGILHQSWVYNRPPFNLKKFNELGPELRLENFLPELAEAMQRDPRWMNAAWMNGLADQMEDTALGILRTTRAPLPVSVVAAVAAKAETRDYPALRNHSLIAIPLSDHDPDFSGPLPDRVLWQRLRALPGFDWRSPVLELWRKAFTESHSFDSRPPVLRGYAALAGDANALNELLEAKAVGSKDDAAQLTDAEWAELASMIDGIPQEDQARTAWLRENRGYFTWDETARKYRVERPAK